MTPRNRVSLILSALLVVLGVVAIVAHRVGAAATGVAVGYIFGAALTLAGLGRGWLALQMSRRDS